MSPRGVNWSGTVGKLSMTYEYKCFECKHEWEAEQKISEPKLTTCPDCKGESAIRQISGICGSKGFVLKGRGWYADGY
jgi:putative FmdB family regulatory protein